MTSNNPDPQPTTTSKKEKAVSVQPIVIHTQVSSVSIAVRSYFSPQHLYAALKFQRLAAAEEVNPSPNHELYRAYATNSFLSSVAFLEAAINELLQDAADNEQAAWNPNDHTVWRNLGAFWKALGGDSERRNLRSKFEATLHMIGAPPFDRGAEPYQSFALVLGVRNALVHYKPMTQSDLAPHELSAQLQTKSIAPSPFAAGGNPLFPDKIIGSGGAHWAVTSSTNFADEFFKRAGFIAPYTRHTPAVI